MEIAALVVAVIGVLITLYVAWVARKLQYKNNLILAVIFNALTEGVKIESLGRILEPLTQAGYLSLITEADGHRYLVVSKKGEGILGARVGKIKKLPPIPIDIKWD